MYLLDRSCLRSRVRNRPVVSTIFRLVVDKSVWFRDVRPYLLWTRPYGLMSHVSVSFECSFLARLVYDRTSVTHYRSHSSLPYLHRHQLFYCRHYTLRSRVRCNTYFRFPIYEVIQQSSIPLFNSCPLDGMNVTL